ncbi:MAG: hypothetical protein ACKVOW_16480 [Chitinophagaceae bacterium]
MSIICWMTIAAPILPKMLFTKHAAIQLSKTIFYLYGYSSVSVSNNRHRKSLNR